MTICTINGLVNGPVHNLLKQFFALGSSKIEVFETSVAVLMVVFLMILCISCSRDRLIIVFAVV